ncbi:MAG TPA: FMN-binding negative transcriptional regulator [Aggregatilineales bacterium]|nr:FMN-binding negative transcriptional regulator [Aggregatilineales bacterium]
MYIPRQFREDDPAVLQEFMRQNNFAVLVTQQGGDLHASHLPFLIDPSRGEHGTLLAHTARANDQWRDFADPSAAHEALVIFHGPHAYITPSWYESAPTNVPTWNLTAVHAYGLPRIIEDHAEMYAMLKRLVSVHEVNRERPWPMESSDNYIHQAIAAIVGFEIPIAHLEGKFKLSQNRSEIDQAQVIEGLSASGSLQDAEVAALMRERLRKNET